MTTQDLDRLKALKARNLEAMETECRAMTLHLRAPLPRLGGNSFYRDKTDRTAQAHTLCSAPVSARDLPLNSARASIRAGWDVCPICRVFFEKGVAR